MTFQHLITLLHKNGKISVKARRNHVDKWCENKPLFRCT